MFLSRTDLSRSWTLPLPILGRNSAGLGPDLDRSWAGPRPVLVRTSAGSDRYSARFGPDLSRSLLDGMVRDQVGRVGTERDG